MAKQNVPTLKGCELKILSGAAIVKSNRKRNLNENWFNLVGEKKEEMQKMKK